MGRLPLKSKHYNPHTLIFIALGTLLTVIVLLAAYRTLSRTMARLSADFYYPYLKTAKNLEVFTVRQSLMSRSKTELLKLIDRLQKENTYLAPQAAQVFQLQRENEQLRDLLALKKNSPFQLQPAEILMRDPMTWSNLFTIDKGEEAGIREGDMVVATLPGSDGGHGITAVVGRIKSVSKHTAVVATIYNEECTLSVVLPESSSYGVLQGESGPASRNAIIRYLPLDAKYGQGEVVMTSGFSSRSAPGFYLGTLQADQSGNVAFIAERGHLYAEARVRSALNIDQLRFVNVMIRETPK